MAWIFQSHPVFPEELLNTLFQFTRPPIMLGDIVKINPEWTNFAIVTEGSVTAVWDDYNIIKVTDGTKTEQLARFHVKVLKPRAHLTRRTGVTWKRFRDPKNERVYGAVIMQDESFGGDWWYIDEVTQ